MGATSLHLGIIKDLNTSIDLWNKEVLSFPPISMTIRKKEA
jgi:hypothetical protein